MRRRSVPMALFLCVAALFVVSDGRAAHQHKVLTLSVDATSKPFWIAADAATTAAGEVNYDGFDAGVRQIARAQAVPVSRRRTESVEAGEPCTSFTVGFDGPRAAMSTWRAALENSDAVVSGTVVAVSPGFFMVTPASMLTVHVDAAGGLQAAYPSGLDLMVRYLGADSDRVLALLQRRFAARWRVVSAEGERPNPDFCIRRAAAVVPPRC